jgi:hypothetical protein
MNSLSKYWCSCRFLTCQSSEKDSDPDGYSRAKSRKRHSKSRQSTASNCAYAVDLWYNLQPTPGYIYILQTLDDRSSILMCLRFSTQVTCQRLSLCKSIENSSLDS